MTSGRLHYRVFFVFLYFSEVSTSATMDVCCHIISYGLSDRLPRMAGDPDDKSLSDPWGHLFLQNETGPTGGRPGGGGLGGWRSGQGDTCLKGSPYHKGFQREKGQLGGELGGRAVRPAFLSARGARSPLGLRHGAGATLAAGPGRSRSPLSQPLAAGAQREPGCGREGVPRSGCEA